MEVERRDHEHKHPYTIKRRRPIRLVEVLALVIIIIIVLAALALIQAPPIYSISSNRTLSVATNKSAYLSLSNGKEFSIFVPQSSNSSAVVYLTPVPVLGSQVMEFVMSPGALINVSTSYTSSANLQFKLISSSARSSTFGITLIPSSFGIKTSPNILFLNATVKKGVTPARNQSVVVSTTTSTTATTTGTTAGSTTTVSSGIPLQQIFQVVNGTTVGALMKNYNQLYVKDTTCTPSSYNSTYQQYKHSTPTGANDYYNVTLRTWSSISTSVSNLGDGDYSVTYDAHAPQTQFGGPILYIAMNLSSSTIKSVTYEGEWAGLNFTVINASYNYQAAISGNCGAYITYVP